MSLDKANESIQIANVKCQNNKTDFDREMLHSYVFN